MAMRAYEAVLPYVPPKNVKPQTWASNGCRIILLQQTPQNACSMSSAKL
jgi:hypothetical protein